MAVLRPKGRGADDSSRAIVATETMESADERLHRQPLLSICIPTYKRANFVEAQVQCVIDAFLSRSDYEVELIVVNNMSPDDTIKRLKGLKHPKFKLINRTEHYDTAEENMIRSLEYLSGEYVWFLGDDDPIQLGSVDRVLAQLEARNFSCFIYNSTTISGDGSLVDLQPMPMNGPQISGPIDELIEMIGLVNTFAGISNIIQLRSRLDCNLGLEWMQTSKIYSHVAWFIQSHQGGLATFVNMPLVLYRQNDYSDGHWDRVAERLKVQSLYFWSLGIVRLLERLMELGCISARQTGQIFELASSGLRYRLIDDIVFKTFTQLMKSCNTESSRELLTDVEFREIKRFALRCDPSLYNVMELLGDAHSVIYQSRQGKNKTSVISKLFHSSGLEEVANSLSQTFLYQYNQRQSQGQFIGRFSGVICEYEIYRMPQCYVAVKQGNSFLRDGVLRYVDPLPQTNLVFTSRDYEGIVDQIFANKQREVTCITPEMATSDIRLTIDAVLRDELKETTEVMKSQTKIANAGQNDAVAILSAVYNSTSWRITAPLRRLKQMTGNYKQL